MTSLVVDLVLVGVEVVGVGVLRDGSRHPGERIGLEAENERLTIELDRARARATTLRTRLDNVTKKLQRQQRNTRKLRREVEVVRKRLAAQRRLTQARALEIAELRSSRTWRVGRALVRPASLLRR